MIICKACFIDTYGHITLETFHAYFPCYTSHRAHTTTSQLGWTRPVLIEAGNQSVDVHRSSGWSPYRSLLLLFLSNRFWHVPQKGESKISVWNFLPTTWRKKDVTVQNSHIEQMEKQLFCPLPYLTANWVTVSCSVTLIHITHVMVIIFQIFWLYRIALFIKEISFLWQIMNVSQHADISLVHPLYCSQVAPGLHSNSWHLDLTLLCPSFLTVFFFVKSLKSSGEENKLSLYNLWPCPSIYLVGSVTVAWVAVKCCAVHCLSFPN